VIRIDDGFKQAHKTSSRLDYDIIASETHRVEG